MLINIGSRRSDKKATLSHPNLNNLTKTEKDFKNFIKN